MLFWNHLGISFPLSTGSTGKTNFWVLWAGPDLTLTFMILTWPSPGTWTSRTPCISWYKSNYSNIRIFCIIRIFVHWFPKKRILFVIRIRPILISEYYSLFVFVPFSLFVATLVHASSGPGSMTKASSVRWAKNPFKATIAKGKLNKKSSQIMFYG